MCESESDVIFITGGGQGLGRVLVQKFAEQGAKVFFTYRTPRESINNIVNDSGGNVYAFQADASNYSQVVSSVEEAVKVFGKIDVLINNAASAKAA